MLVGGCEECSKNALLYLRNVHCAVTPTADCVSEKLGGMNENSASVAVNDDMSSAKSICECVLTAGNLLQVPSSDENVFKFSAKTLASGTLVLVSVKVSNKKAKVTVNSEKMVIGTMLLKDIQKAMEKK